MLMANRPPGHCQTNASSLGRSFPWIFLGRKQAGCEVSGFSGALVRIRRSWARHWRWNSFPKHVHSGMSWPEEGVSGDDKPMFSNMYLHGAVIFSLKESHYLSHNFPLSAWPSQFAQLIVSLNQPCPKIFFFKLWIERGSYCDVGTFWRWISHILTWRPHGVVGNANHHDNRFGMSLRWSVGACFQAKPTPSFEA